MMADPQRVKRALIGALGLAFVSWILAGCDKRDTPPAEWVVQVGTQRVSTVSFEQEWVRRQALQERPIQPADVVGGVVSDWQAYLAASSLGILDEPDLQSAIRKLVANRAREVITKRLSKPEWETSVVPEEIEAAYRGQPSRWQKPAAWNMAWLVSAVSPKAQADRRAAVRDRIEEYRRQVAASGDPKATFALLCSQHSDDTATRYLGGELGWLTREQLTGRLGADGLKAIDGLSATNRLSSVLETSNRMVLLFQIGHRPVQLRPLDEVAPQIRGEIERTRDAAQKKALEQELHRLVPVKTNLAVLSGIKPPTPPVQRPAAPSPMPKP